MKSKNNLVFFFVLLIMSCTFVHRSKAQDDIKYVGPDYIRPRNIMYVDAKVYESTNSLWQTSVTWMPGKKDLDTLYFINPKQGWIGGVDALYATDDGGKTWQRSPLFIPNGARVEEIFFTGPLTGWVALEYDGRIWEREQDHFWLMQTIDGGRTWRVNREGQSEICKILFIDERQGWITIAHRGDNYWSTIQMTIQVYRTTDQGKNWTEITSNINQIRSHGNDIVSGMIPESPSGLTMITTKGEIIRTADAGKSWKRDDISFGEYPHESPFRRLGIKDNGRLWTVRGGGLFVQKDNEIWTSYSLGVKAFDALFTSDKQAFACGIVRGFPRPAKPGDLELVGMVMASSDGGLNWSIIYQSPEKLMPITRLYAVDAKHLFAVGEGGLVVRLEYVQ